MLRRLLPLAWACLLWPRAVFAADNTSCLLWQGSGCEQIRDKELCVHSRDGLASDPFAASRAGTPCAWHKSGVCTHYGSQVVYAGDYEVATCKASATIEETIAAYPAGKAILGTQVEVFPMHGGTDRVCRGAAPTQTGKHARLYDVWTAATLDDCKALCTGKCAGIEYHASGKYCEVWKAEIQHSESRPGFECYARANEGGAIATSRLNLTMPDMANLRCLTSQPSGCVSVTDKLTCLSSVDGSSDPVSGVTIRGQPCVWCGDVPCTDEGSYGCAPYSLLSQGAGKAFKAVTAPTAIVAVCHDQEVDFDAEELTCLREATEGCTGIHEKKTCESSKEAASAHFVAGFKAKGEPCVWCGGGLCNDGTAALCEPYDFAVHGEGHAFQSKFNGYFTRAACDKDNQPMAEPLAADQFTKGRNSRVDCGHPFPVWKKVGQRCGFCKVLVPNIKDEYQTCSDYCAHQGGMTCKSASLGFIKSCGVSAQKSCDYAFQMFEHGLCECAPNQHFEVQNAAVAAAVPAPAEEEMACLQTEARGCASIQDQSACLGSKDGSAIEAQYGFKVAGEPCVWCGGVPCTSRHPNVFCEARDLVVNGAGLAFATRGADAASMKVAMCKDGKPVDYALTVDTLKQGMHMPVDCGVPYPIWRGVGSQCGFCQVQVAPEAAKSYRTCDGYCKAQGGIACEKAFLGREGSCDEMSRISCSQEITGMAALCRCQAPKAKESTANLHFAKALPRPDEADLQCLKRAEGGCGGIRDKETCLGSKDAGMEEMRGLKIYGEPCVWCGGGLCTDHSASLCLAYDFLAGGLGLTFGVRAPAGVSEVATCSKEATEPEMLGAAAPPVKVGAAAGPSVDAQCSSHGKCSKLSGNCCPNDAGVFLDCCNNFQPVSAVAPDQAKAVVVPAVAGSEVDATVGAVVVPKVPVPAKLDYLEAMPEKMPQAPKLPEARLGMAAPNWKPRRPSQAELGCMKPEPKGCGFIKHKLMCLSRIDGREGYKSHGLNVGGEPCVWCGGGPCTSNSDALCEPYDWLMNGEGKAYGTLNAATWLVAKCQDDRNAVFDNLSCLKGSEIGCNNIKDRGLCLKSKDSRPYDEIAGFKAEGQPCVWCGGGSCHSNNDNACEPYDFVMNGAGQAFDYTYSHNTYLVAECKEGHAKAGRYPAAHVERGLPNQVKCGKSTKTWESVGKVCGHCDVTVPNINATFQSCSKYCSAHGLKCVGSGLAFTHSCEVQPVGYVHNCDHVFVMGDYARCQCSHQEPAAGQEPTASMLLPASPYAQCGGKNWEGVETCQVGSHCNVVNEWYSQCLPGDLSNPDQAAAAAKVAAEAAGKEIQDQAAYAGEAATKAAQVAGMTAVTQAVRGYVGGAQTGWEGGLDKPEAKEIGEAAARNAVEAAGLTGEEAAAAAAQAIEEGKVIVFGDETVADATAIAAASAAKIAKDDGKSPEEQCKAAYVAAVSMSKVEGKGSPAAVAGKLAGAEGAKAGLQAKGQVDCVVKAAQEQGHGNGENGDTVAVDMKTAGESAAKGTQIPPNQVTATVESSMKDTEVSPASQLKLPQELLDKCRAAGEAEATAAAAASAAAVAATKLGKGWGLSAADTAESARKCAFEAAEAKGASASEATAAAEAAVSTAASAVTGPAAGAQMEPHPLKNIGEDCWYFCAKRSGLCAYCGMGNACCQRSEPTPDRVCQDVTSYVTDHHECVTPVHQPLDVDDVGTAVSAAVTSVSTGKAKGSGATAATAATAAGAAAVGYAAGSAAGSAGSTVVVNGGDKSTVAVVPVVPVVPRPGVPGAARPPLPGAAVPTATVAPAVPTATVAPVDAVTVAPVTTPEPVPVTTAALMTETVSVPAVTTPKMPELTTVPIDAVTVPAVTVPDLTTVPIEAVTVPPLTTPDVTGVTVPPVAGVTVPPLTTPDISGVTVPPVAGVTLPSVTTPELTTLPVGDVTVPPLPDLTTVSMSPSMLKPGALPGSIKDADVILPQPIPTSIEAGIKAAETEKEANTDVQTQAIAAAATTGSYAAAQAQSQDEAKDAATKVAAYVFHKEGGKSVAEAEAAADKVVKSVMDAEGGKFATRQRLKNQFKDCWSDCGEKPGYCDEFCGQGNACCRKTGDTVVPDECTKVFTFYTPHYECVVPSVAYVPAAVLPATKAKEAGADGEMVVSGITVTEDTEGKAKAQNSWWMWLLILAAGLLICCAGIIGWQLSKGTKAGRLRVSRKGAVSDSSPASRSGAGDLELQAPLVPTAAATPVPFVTGAQAMPASMPAIPSMSMPAVPAMPMQSIPSAQYQYVPVPASAQGHFPSGACQIQSQTTYTAAARAPAASGVVDPFDRIDANHDGVLSRQEWESAVQAGSVAVAGTSVATAARATSCRNCGNIYAADSNFCRKCGQQRA